MPQEKRSIDTDVVTAWASINNDEFNEVELKHTRKAVPVINDPSLVHIHVDISKKYKSNAIAYKAIRDNIVAIEEKRITIVLAIDSLKRRSVADKAIADKIDEWKLNVKGSTAITYYRKFKVFSQLYGSFNSKNGRTADKTGREKALALFVNKDVTLAKMELVTQSLVEALIDHDNLCENGDRLSRNIHSKIVQNDYPTFKEYIDNLKDSFNLTEDTDSDNEPDDNSEAIEKFKQIIRMITRLEKAGVKLTVNDKALKVWATSQVKALENEA